MKHIVLIEDNEALQQLVAQFLTEAGYRVTSYPALTSVEELATLEADLFIIDERLPSVSGHIICILLHADSVTRAVPQLLISGSPVLSKFSDLAEVNASLRKPFGLDELLLKIKELI
ncbi:response regulator [Mucilaginibacter sp. CAU 1740]|uniref:response regulator n=1 Tax=Mucilaginibacter sp. CAU 1740 TaxID=3140365 RepID=UPI00325AF0F7